MTDILVIEEPVVNVLELHTPAVSVLELQTPGPLGGSSVPGGVSGEYQYNNGGAFAGASGVLYSVAIQHEVTAQFPTSIPRAVKGAVGQTADLDRIRNSSNIDLWRVLPNGVVALNTQGLVPPSLGTAFMLPALAAFDWANGAAKFGYNSLISLLQSSIGHDIFGSVNLRQQGSSLRMVTVDTTSTPGNVTVIAAKGKLTIPAGSQSVTVTLGLMSASTLTPLSHVIATLQTVDGTNHVASVIPLSTPAPKGSFTINLAAVASINVDVAWTIINT